MKLVNWYKVSGESIDLIVNMLNKNPDKWFTADECLNHIVFKKLEEENINK